MEVVCEELGERFLKKNEKLFQFTKTKIGTLAMFFL